MSLFCFQPCFKLCCQPLLSASLTACLRFPFLGAMILILAVNVHWALDQLRGHTLRPVSPAGRIPLRQLRSPQGVLSYSVPRIRLSWNSHPQFHPQAAIYTTRHWEHLGEELQQQFSSVFGSFYWRPVLFAICVPFRVLGAISLTSP